MSAPIFYSNQLIRITVEYEEDLKWLRNIEEKMNVSKTSVSLKTTFVTSTFRLVHQKCSIWVGHGGVKGERGGETCLRPIDLIPFLIRCLSSNFQAIVIIDADVMSNLIG